jgi:DNA-3-methyladenine glycosylase II
MAPPSVKKMSAHLMAADPALASIITATTVPRRSPSRDPYLALIRSITAQQISVAAASTIYGRLTALFEDAYPHPEKMLDYSIDELRAVGLSRSKAAYMQNVAQYTLERSLSIEQLKPLSNEEVIRQLTQIKGVGRWTVEMLLMFPLNRLDVFPLGDVGIQNTMIKHYRLRSKGPALRKRLTAISGKWQPYRSIACKYLWNWADSDTQSPW